MFGHLTGGRPTLPDTPYPTLDGSQGPASQISCATSWQPPGTNAGQQLTDRDTLRNVQRPSTPPMACGHPLPFGLEPRPMRLGVESVEINRKQQKVTVQGFVEAQRVLRRAQSTGKRVELWPYVPYTNLYVAPPVYDKRAPPGHVRRVDTLIAPAAGHEEHLATLFSDDNPNACSIM